jgi:hypothetical protein
MPSAPEALLHACPPAPPPHPIPHRQQHQRHRSATGQAPRVEHAKLAPGRSRATLPRHLLLQYHPPPGPANKLARITAAQARLLLDPALQARPATERRCGSRTAEGGCGPAHLPARSCTSSHVNPIQVPAPGPVLMPPKARGGANRCLTLYSSLIVPQSAPSPQIDLRFCCGRQHVIVSFQRRDLSWPASHNTRARLSTTLEHSTNHRPGTQTRPPARKDPHDTVPGGLSRQPTATSTCT